MVSNSYYADFRGILYCKLKAKGDFIPTTKECECHHHGNCDNCNVPPIEDNEKIEIGLSRYAIADILNGNVHKVGKIEIKLYGMQR